MKKELYNNIESYMLECMKDSAHDKEHIYRVLYMALDIAEYYTRRATLVANERQQSAAAFYTSMLKEVKSCYAKGKSELERKLSTNPGSDFL